MKQIQAPHFVPHRQVVLGVVAIGMFCIGLGCRNASEQVATAPERGGPVARSECCSPTGQQSVELSAVQAVPQEHLGYSLAASENTIAVGAKDSSRTGLFQSGAVIVFDRSGDSDWRQSDVLTPRDAEAGDHFGFSVALSGTFLAVGAPFGTTSGVNTGVVHVFSRASNGRWVEVESLRSPYGGAFELFGYSIAMEGDRMVVGALQAGPEQHGAAFVYARGTSGWQLEAILQASDGAPFAKLGSSVAISGNKILVGAMSDGQLAPASGAAYVFQRDDFGWSQKAKLVAEDGARSDFFGFSTALAQDTAVIGTYLKKNMAGSAVGAVYVFKDTGSGWAQQEKLVPTDASPGDAFGISISVLGDVMAVGSSHNDGAGRNAGAVYIFRKGDGQWRQLTKLHRLAAHEGDEYGRSVALSNAGFVAAGAWMTGAHAPEAGAVEVTSHPGTICADDCPILRCGREHEVEDPAQRVPSTAKPRPPTWCELD